MLIVFMPFVVPFEPGLLRPLVSQGEDSYLFLESEGRHIDPMIVIDNAERHASRMFAYVRLQNDELLI